MGAGEERDQFLGEEGQGERPGKARRRGENKQDHARHRCAVNHAVQQPPQPELAIQETGHHETIDDREGRDFRRGAEARQDAAEQDDRHKQGQHGAQAGLGHLEERGPGHPPHVPAPGLKIDQHHETEPHDRGRDEARDEEGPDRKRGDRPQDQHGDTRRHGFPHHGRGRQDRGGALEIIALLA